MMKNSIHGKTKNDKKIIKCQKMTNISIGRVMVSFYSISVIQRQFRNRKFFLRKEIFSVIIWQIRDDLHVKWHIIVPYALIGL